NRENVHETRQGLRVGLRAGGPRLDPLAGPGGLEQRLPGLLRALPQRARTGRRDVRRPGGVRLRRSLLSAAVSAAVPAAVPADGPTAVLPPALRPALFLPAGHPLPRQPLLRAGPHLPQELLLRALHELPLQLLLRPLHLPLPAGRPARHHLPAAG